MIEPRAAATVMIARDSPAGVEIFMLRRSAASTFMPDVFVFPGGRVDDADASPEARERLTGDLPPLDPAYLIAAARETFEESGLLFGDVPVGDAARATARAALARGAATFARVLTELGARIDGSALRYFSRWVTPPGESRRFDTHFFVARAPWGQAARADAAETHDGIWITPGAALRRHRAGTFALIYPTIKHLERVRDFTSTDALLAFARSKPIRTVMPAADAGVILMPPELEGAW